MKPLVSILIPAYNAAPWIGETIQSALRQDWPRTEIIVVDDGSRDKTLAVARSFSVANLSVVTQKNAGASAARNRAFSLCRGDYIQWLDADDLLAADKISRQMEVVEKCADPRTLFSSEWGQFMFASPARRIFARHAASGPTSRPWNGCSANWRKISTCSRPHGWSAVN